MERIYDVCIVGAGPSGSTCAYYTSLQGKQVLLLEKHQFPRDKYCGDAVVPRAQQHLKKMGVLDELLAEKSAVFTVSGGFISPSGIECVSNSSHNPNGRVMSVKRIILDEKIARAAQRAGAELIENCEVTAVEWDQRSGTWTVSTLKGKFRGRMLVLADGAQSTLARSLGLVQNPPDAICSRAFVDGNSHHFDLDGICYMPKKLLPGYAAVFRHPNDELNFCCYIIPGGECSPRDLKTMHHELLATNTDIRRHLGDQYTIEKMRGAWLRLGGIDKSYADHLLIIGDAAGHIDPLTGEGIHLAIEGAECAASTIQAAFSAGDFSEQFLARYHRAWMERFGKDFRISRLASKLMARFPRLIDAMAATTQKQGDKFFLAWGDVMTGSSSWSRFLKPDLALPLAKELVRFPYRESALAH